MTSYIGNKLTPEAVMTTEELQQRSDPSNKEQAGLVDEMRAQLKKLQDMRKHEDPRLSFSTPEFKEAQRTFTDGFKRNFGRPVEWAMVKRHPWSVPQLVKLEQPVDVTGKPWPLDKDGNAILSA